MYYPNGVVSSEFEVDNDSNIIGDRKYYDSTGSLYQIIHFENGKMNGLAKSFYGNGDKIKNLVEYKNDSVVNSKHFDSNGVILNERLSKGKYILFDYYKNGKSLYEKYYTTDVLNDSGVCVYIKVDSLFVFRFNGTLLSSTKTINKTVYINIGNERFEVSASDTVARNRLSKYRKQLLGKDTLQIDSRPIFIHGD